MHNRLASCLAGTCLATIALLPVAPALAQAVSQPSQSPSGQAAPDAAPSGRQAEPQRRDDQRGSHVSVPNSVLPSSFAFQPLPYDEDYTRLGDPTMRYNAWLKLKNIPIVGSTFLTLGTEVRGRVEVRNHLNFGRGREDHGAYPQYRARVWADVHVSDNLRVFGEVQSSGIARRPTQYGAIDGTGTDLHQLFAQVNLPLAGGDLMVRAGRQEISFGKARIFDTRNGPNTRRAYDAGRIVYKADGWRAGAFVGAVVRDRLESWADDTNHDFTFWGGNLAHTIGGPLPHSEAELLFVETNRKAASAPTYIGKRQTVSLRVAGKEGKLDYDAEFIAQRGHSRIGKVRAWAIGVDAAYQLPGSLSPRVGTRIDIGSGDKRRNDSVDGTYDYLGSRGMTLTGELGFSNLISAGPTFGFKPAKRLSVEMTTSKLFRTTRADGVYSMTSAQIRSPEEGRSRDVGFRVTARVDHQWNKFLLSGIYAAWIDAGKFLKQTGDGKNMSYVAFYTVLRL